MRELKVSAIVAISVTVLAVVTAFAFSFATISYQKEVANLRRINVEYRRTLEGYKSALMGIKNQLAQVGLVVE